MYAITTFQMMVLRWITKRIVIQSQSHKTNIIEYFRILNQAAQDQFCEDNKITLDSFLQECFDTALDKHNGQR